jgi:hypothetical protein
MESGPPSWGTSSGPSLASGERSSSPLSPGKSILDYHGVRATILGDIIRTKPGIRREIILTSLSR